MSNLANNYDHVARYYDWLSGLIFGNTLRKVQIAVLPAIPANSKVLIAGGGTGWILEEITKIHPRGVAITYVELSSKMIEIARKRNFRENSVQFIKCPVESFISNTSYDVIITPFLFDNFKKEKAEAVFYRLHHQLKEGGIWLFSDFAYHAEKDAIWKGTLLKVMYAFFQRVCDVEATELPSLSNYFEQQHYQKIEEVSTLLKFIKSEIYRKHLS